MIKKSSVWEKYPPIVKSIPKNILPYRLIDDIRQQRAYQQPADIQIARKRSEPRRFTIHRIGYNGRRA